MFTNKEEFKTAYINKLVEKYGVSVAEAHITEKYDVLGELIREYAGRTWRTTRTKSLEKNHKQLIYFSMEFLMGRLLTNNLQNLGIYDLVNEGLTDLGIELNELEDAEDDAGLGNGGLGRLAACYLDSIASLGYTGNGNTLRYEYGFFKQKFVNSKQTELPDQWLNNGYVWEVRKPKHAVEVEFYGYPETYIKPNGDYALRTANALHMTAMPYDVSIVGYGNKVCNTLRLWSAEPSKENLPNNMSFDEYVRQVKEICHSLYPNDSNEEGKILRLKQEYFLVSAGLQSCIRTHLRLNKGSLDGFEKSFVFQLNDTHPILAIPELMRLAMDVYGYGWDYSWNMVQKCIAFTNHTIMSEALEKWPVHYMQKLLPRIFMIIEEINRRFNIELTNKNIDGETRNSVQIIKDGQIYMANLAIVAGYSVNGVAEIHTEILKELTFKNFYKLFPEKFNNITNGVTHRRWLMYCNPGLTKLLDTRIGTTWKVEPSKLHDFAKFADTKVVQNNVMKIKNENKKKFAEFMQKQYGITINPNTIFDTQVKRLHAYKRQLMNIFRIMYFYKKLKEGASFTMPPVTFIFGAKAAPSYVFAKKIIELINAVAQTVNNDPYVSKFMKVVFVENYGVTLAEKIIPASDISEQISTAGYEASGTSNMKFMMNGALTLGTLDGANIEIAEHAGNENEFIFGLTKQEVLDYQFKGTYSAAAWIDSNPMIKEIIGMLFNGPWAEDERDRFKLISDELLFKNDEYFVLRDLPSYIEQSLKAFNLYAKDKSTWAKMCIYNIAESGYFSSDRSINEYVKDIWKLKKVI